MIEEVWRAASSSRRIERIVVATDDDRIVAACEEFGAEAIRTSPSHRSGTDRVAEVLDRLDEPFDVVVNIQGDEPLVTGSSLDGLVEALAAAPSADIATLAEPLDDADDLFDPHVVKVVIDDASRALYFSRAPIPYHRGDGTVLEADFRRALRYRPGGLSGYRKHQGIYAYRTGVLRAVTRLAPSPLELDEGLEQLRALGAGYSIVVVPSDFRSIAVDTPADLERVRRRLSTPAD
jgi:3-deoxy-manno-octulosonate cytidylyltransferase (CMP-KDO synthetase)